jgi:hypothetical protein
MPENTTPTRTPTPAPAPPNRVGGPPPGGVFDPSKLQRFTIGTVGYFLHGKIVPQERTDLTKFDFSFGRVTPNGPIEPYPGPREIAARQFHIPAQHYIGLEFEVPSDPALMGYGLHMLMNNVEFSNPGLNLCIAGMAGDFNGLANVKNLGNNDTPVLYHRLAKVGRPINKFILDVQPGAKLVLNMASANPSKEGVFVLDWVTGRY